MFKYDLHCHSAEGSKCSKLPAKEMPHYYKSLGYDGFFVTDHFEGNTTVPQGSSWKARIEYFYHYGYEIAKEEGDKIGIKVWFAPEESLRCNDFLILGLDKDWWLRQEDYFDLAPNARFDRIHEGGGFVIHAHPFAEAPWIESIRLFPRKVDAVEVFNGGGTEEFNRNAIWYAKAYGLPMTGGTDTHTNEERNLCGIESERACFTVQDIIDVIRDGTAKPFSALHNDLLYK